MPAHAPLPAIDPDRPFVFASLGTMQGGRQALFERIVLACRQVDVQLLLAHCGGLDARQAHQLRELGAEWVVDFAPQQAALERADAVISHAGWNTIMDAIATGTPMLALPIAFDHPGGAARVRHAGIGIQASARFAGPRTLARHLRTLLDDPAFRQRLQPLAAAVARAVLPCALLLAAASLASAATVEIHVTGVAGARGKVSAAVCDRERFLKQRAYSASAPSQSGETVLRIAGVPPGGWAVLAYQDENENGKLDRNLLGIPSENYGFSRDARGRFGPPSFDDAVIEVKDGPTVATVRLR